MRDGTLSPEDVAQLELPWSAEMVDGFRLMVGGTIQAALIACGLERQSRKARRDEALRTLRALRSASSVTSAAACTTRFRITAKASVRSTMSPSRSRVLQARGLERVAIVDLDVHHGNGTAFIFESDPRVFTFSMHQQHNYPMWKPRGSLDIGLPDGAHDATYLRELERALPAVMAHRPQCVFYLAGADPYEDDQLGGLRLTKTACADAIASVIDAVRRAGVPLVITLAGGYARRVEDTVAIHVATIEEAAAPRPRVDRRTTDRS